MTDLTAQRAALAAAKMIRAEYLIAITSGVLEPDDLFTAAQSTDGRALRVIELKQVLISPPKPPAPWKVIKTRMLSALEADLSISDKKLTVGWLLDPRAGGRRWYALQDALRPRDQPPIEGFHWT